ncbi:hypothetical protein Pmani_014949 [Petrolisthes manimaculis]|uniref:Uncharacterized protein n=1 Tax=Petrolisthes manimaculis TaxID=1843537 RepID=A0AAE1U7U7_9EUCA|nr:hypothetical protein Pmani_014949 [Petrolisthes manimaculis]
MTVDSGGGGSGRGASNGSGGETGADSETREKELRTRLINYHTSFSSQDSNHPLNVNGNESGSSNGVGWIRESQDNGTTTTANNGHLEDFPMDDPDSLGTLWPDDPDSGHPFTKAALQGDVGTVMEYVRRQTFDPNSKKAQHALLVACRTGQVEMTQVLLEAGVDVHCKDAKSGWQPIHIAAYRDHVAVVEALAMHGEWRQGVGLVRFRGITCNLLHLAASFGCLAVLRYLLSHTVRLCLQLESRDAAHWTALHHAALEGRHQAVTLLLQAGSDVNSADPHGVTALHVAAYKDHPSIVSLLLSRGANPKMIVKSPTSGMLRQHRPTRVSCEERLPVNGEGMAFRSYSLDTLFRRRRQWSPALVHNSWVEFMAAQDDGTIRLQKWKEKINPNGAMAKTSSGDLPPPSPTTSTKRRNHPDIPTTTARAVPVYYNTHNRQGSHTKNSRYDGKLNPRLGLCSNAT